ncbi:hypothetical protein BLA29_011409, partial [Euroglyphus maynei]
GYIGKAELEFSEKEIQNHYDKLNRPKKIYLKIEFSSSEQQLFQGDFNLTHDSMIYFQTDKPIYRPNEMVRFRVLEIDRSLNSKSDICNLTIKNHQKIKLDFISLTLEAPYYIAEYEFQLPQIAKEGIWEAELFCN